MKATVAVELLKLFDLHDTAKAKCDEAWAQAQAATRGDRARKVRRAQRLQAAWWAIEDQVATMARSLRY